MFDRDVATGKRNVSSLIDALMNFAVGNEIMIDSLFKRDTHFHGKKMFSMVSTHPGMIKTDLHNGQGLAFAILEEVAVRLIGITEEEAGVRQSSILVSKKLHPHGLSLVDHFGYGRIRDPELSELVEQNRVWLWSFLTSMEEVSC